jgi:excisionase family DNA binding protein
MTRTATSRRLRSTASIIAPTPAPNIEPLAYSIDQAGVLLGLSPRTIKRLIARGEIIARKVGGRTILPAVALKKFLTRDHSTT